MACTFFKAMGLETGKSLVEADRVDMAKDLLSRERRQAAAARRRARWRRARRTAIARTRWSATRFPPNEAMFDIGPDSAASFAAAIVGAKTVLWNGPMGVFETKPFDAGTRAVADAMAQATKNGATTIVGGGDSAAAVAEMGLEAR